MDRLVGLLALIGEHHEALEADLSQFHGLRLAQVGTRALSWRRFQALVRHLPPESALWRAMDSPRQWGWSEHMAAASLLALNAANWQRGGGKGAKPKPVRPPGSDRGASRRIGTAMPMDEMRALLDEWGAPDEEVSDVG